MLEHFLDRVGRRLTTDANGPGSSGASINVEPAAHDRTFPILRVCAMAHDSHPVLNGSEATLTPTCR